MFEKQLQAKHGAIKCKTYVCDITSEAQVQQTFASIRREFSSIDVLLNNAGANSRKKVDSYTLIDWEMEINANLTGTFLNSMAAFHYMKQQGAGHIVNFSSIKGKEATSSIGYGAAKSGVIGLTKSLAKQLIAHGVYVNCIAPGFIDAGMTHLLSADELKHYLKMIPLGRIGSIKEVYSVIKFLISPASSYIVGATIDVNGGYLMD
jgi:3-oxoacyl-[acyl-carrier protein] reductase